MKYADDHYLWHKHVTGIELNPHQVMWSNRMDTEGDNHMLIGSRRIRKSFTVASYLLKIGATIPNSEINIHSPALEQSKRNMRYMTDMILKSEILMAYIDQRLGEGIGKEHIEFLNGSRVQAKGQASSIDGLGATHQWLEEFDDMDWDTFLTRIYPTGSQLKDDHDYKQRKGCFRIITGTIKGIGNIYRVEHPENNSLFKFNVLPKMNCYHGIAMGIIPRADIEIVRSIGMTPHQFARTYLVLYVESANFYSEKALKSCIDFEYTPPDVLLHGNHYHVNRGDVCVGIDAGGAGSSDESSNWAITFTEKIGNKIYWLYTREWPGTENPGKIKKEMADLISYFRPKNGFHDAFDTVFCYDLNIILKEKGITRIDVRKFENKQGKNGWDEWFIKPVRFHGPMKHLMHERTQKYIYGGAFRYPAVIDGDERYSALDKLIKQFGNVKAEKGQGYNKYSAINPKLGLDSVDSTIASIWAQEEIRVFNPGYGSFIPQMEISERHHFDRLGPRFLHETKMKVLQKKITPFDLLKND